ncbi:MAG: adenine phosphoribosyltransferase [Gemmatimonadota bacterium]|nr:adenine phosphoribosyltransferase [Gemmatimonadota bacterium]
MRDAIRDVPDFPKPGIVFKDMTPLLGDAALFRRATEAMAAPFREMGITHVVAIESRGFILGGPVAQSLRAGLVPLRKVGKLPFPTHSEAYGLEYGADRLEIHIDALAAGSRVLVVDDVLATGGTARAAGRLVELLGANVAGYSFLVELDFLAGREQLVGRRIESLIRY